MMFDCSEYITLLISTVIVGHCSRKQGWDLRAELVLSIGITTKCYYAPQRPVPCALHRKTMKQTLGSTILETSTRRTRACDEETS